MRHGSTDIPPNLLHLTFPPPSIDLPANFPDVQTPRYLHGDKLRWIPEGDKTDWGVVIVFDSVLERQDSSMRGSRANCAPSGCRSHLPVNEW
jgi:hypothetical protein